MLKIIHLNSSKDIIEKKCFQINNNEGTDDDLIEKVDKLLQIRLKIKEEEEKSIKLGSKQEVDNKENKYSSIDLLDSIKDEKMKQQIIRDLKCEENQKKLEDATKQMSINPTAMLKNSNKIMKDNSNYFARTFTNKSTLKLSQNNNDDKFIEKKEKILKKLKETEENERLTKLIPISEAFKLIQEHEKKVQVNISTNTNILELRFLIFFIFK
jgi:hypothetical protein